MSLKSKQELSLVGLTRDFKDRLGQARRTKLIARIIKKDISVFGKKEKTHQKVILNRLGWIDAVRQMPNYLERIENFVRQVKEADTRHVLILGMGGSSLCPEVFGKIFGRRGWLKSYDVVDSTAPSQIDAILKKIDLKKSFFIVSSKSGSTVETLSQFRFFFREVKRQRPLKVGNYFAAVTDDGSDLHRIARRNRFRETFLNNKDIGGRYSALSFFGLVPGGFTKVNLNGVLVSANEFLSQLESSEGENDALNLGILMGVAALQGQDKITFRTSPSMAPFIPWIEQLIAESTGKEMKGIMPIEGEPYGGFVHCANDRLYVYYHLKGDPYPSTKTELRKMKKYPTVIIELDDSNALGGEILKWEMATTIASIITGVNPFDEPNVSESKKNTAALLEIKTGHRKIVPESPLIECDDFAVRTASDINGLNLRRELTPAEVFQRFIQGTRPGDYISILAYTEMLPEIETYLTELRKVLGEKNCIATVRGYGPRFLHSIGQLYKGGNPKGHFLVLEREYDVDYIIPRLDISFGKLIKAQMEGDIKALRKRKRPLMHVSLKKNPTAALERIIQIVAGN